MLSSIYRWFKIGLVVAVILAIIVVIIIETTLQPILHSVSKTTIRGLVTTLINKAINQQTDSLSYSDLVSIQTNREGEIILMQPNLQVVNDISSNITLSIQQSIEDLEDREIKIPISQVLGIEILSKFIPSLKAKVVPYGAVESILVDQFESVGINQTKHKIKLRITSRIQVIIPMLSTDIKVTSSVPLTEAVIVGQVPEVYMGLEKGLFNKQKKQQPIK
ncbi:sporulation protein YunB [Halanaerobaculum tunisiense]